MISLEKAVEKIHELINQELGPLLDERTMVARNRALGLPMPEGFGQKERTREKWPEDKLFIGLDSLRNFNIRAKIVGPGGMFVKCKSGFVLEAARSRTCGFGQGPTRSHEDSGTRGREEYGPK